MGEAKRRGAYAVRKQQAIDAFNKKRAAEVVDEAAVERSNEVQDAIDEALELLNEDDREPPSNAEYWNWNDDRI